MKKLLDILIIVLLTFLFVNLFSGKEEQTKNGLFIKMTDKNYTVPASVGIGFSNYTQQVVTFNTCTDISIKGIGGKITFPETACRDVELMPNEEYQYDLSSQYTHFLEAGSYALEAKINDQDYLQTFEIENKGTITKLFTALFYAPLYNFLAFLINSFNHSLGWAIIGITIFIRLLLIYPQHKMMVSQRKLQAIQPKIKKIQEEFKGNQQMLGMKLMELYKKEKVNPMGSCGFLLIQMPILIVVYNIILSIKDSTNLYHIYSFLPSYSIESISFDFFGIDLLAAGGITGAVLAIAVASIQFVQIKLSLLNNKANQKSGVVLEKKAGDNAYSQFMPDPEMMNKFMLYGMPAMVGVFTFTFIAGVGMYWGISTLFMIGQQLVVNKIIKK